MGFDIKGASARSAAAGMDAAGAEVNGLQGAVWPLASDAFGKCLADSAGASAGAATDAGNAFLGALGAAAIASADKVRECIMNYQRTDEAIEHSFLEGNV
jgi:hypothetical protein